MWCRAIPWCAPKSQNNGWCGFRGTGQGPAFYLTCWVPDRWACLWLWLMRCESEAALSRTPTAGKSRTRRPGGIRGGVSAPPPFRALRQNYWFGQLPVRDRTVARELRPTSLSDLLDQSGQQVRATFSRITTIPPRLVTLRPWPVSTQETLPSRFLVSAARSEIFCSKSPGCPEPGSAVPHGGH